MKTTNILYIHGFNSGPGKKVETIKEAGFNCFCPQLKNIPKEDLQTLKECIQKENIHQVVATSLGGYYGLILAQEFTDLKYHLINTSYKPYETLKIFLNTKVKNYKNGEEFFVDAIYLNELKKIKPNLSIISKDSIYFYFGSQDEVLNFDELIKEITINLNSKNIYKEDQDHRFQDIKIVLTKIKTLIL